MRKYLWLAACCLLVLSCKSPDDKRASAPIEGAGEDHAGVEETRAEANEESAAQGEDDRADQRRRMVSEQIEARGVADEQVLDVMRRVPRHLYVLEPYRPHAYDDQPLPIGRGQTISQPFIVAVMSEALQVDGDHKVLEIGTGSGYQAAVLAEMVDELYTIEIICELAEQAESVLTSQGYDNVQVRCGDGYAGWPEQAPFDRIIVTAAPPEIPEALVEQLAVGGRMILPVGQDTQRLQVVTKTADETVEITTMMPVRFVPMVPDKASP